MNRAGKCHTIDGQHYLVIYLLWLYFISYMDAGAEQAELDLSQLFEVLPSKNNEVREGDKGVEGI